MIDILFTYIIRILEIIGVAVIVIGVLKMLFVSGFCITRRIQYDQLITEIRINLSKYLVLSLEIFIGRDIIETLLKPTLDEFIILVVFVVLRTLLAFFLDYEIKHIPKQPLLEKLKK